MTAVEKIRDALSKQDSAFFNKNKVIADSGLSHEDGIAAFKEMEKGGELFFTGLD